MMKLLIKKRTKIFGWRGGYLWMAPRCSAGPEPARQMDARLQGLDSYRASNAANADNWVENERWPHKDDVPLISPLSLSISFHFSTRKCLKHMLLAWPRARVCVCFSASLYIIFIYLFFTPPLTPSLISLSLSSLRVLSISLLEQQCVYIHPVAAATAGGHTSWWMNKRPRDPHPQRDGKSNFIFFFFFQRGEGEYGAYAEREKK